MSRQEGCPRSAQIGTVVPGSEAYDRWLEHLQACVDCRQQWEMHALLAAELRALPCPSLPADFALAVRARYEAPGVRPLLGSRRWVMLAYWCLAFAASLSLLLELGLPGPPSGPFVGTLLVLAAAPVSFVLTLDGRRIFRRLGSRLLPLLG